MRPETPPSNAAYWDSVADEWRDPARGRLWRKLSDAIYIRAMENWQLLPTTGTVLKTDLFDEALAGDLGRALAAKARLFIGLDVSVRTISAAMSHVPTLAAIVADVRALPVAEGTIDLLVSGSTLDHLQTPDEICLAIVALGRALAPAGRLIVTLDNPQHPLLWLRQRLPWRWLRRLRLVPYQVGATLSLAELAAACRQAGLIVERQGTWMHCPRVLAVWLGQLLNSANSGLQAVFIRSIVLFERLANWPTHLVTGRFVAVLASRPAGTDVVHATQEDSC